MRKHKKFKLHIAGSILAPQRILCAYRLPTAATATINTQTNPLDRFALMALVPRTECRLAIA